jgi:hypothetical protein
MQLEKCSLYPSMYKEYCSHCSPRDTGIVNTNRGSFREPEPEKIDSQVLSSLKTIASDVHLRIHWGERADSDVRQYFVKLGLEKQTENILYLENEQWGLSGTVSFPLLPSFLMALLPLHNVVDDRVEINSISFALGLMLEGFPANKAKYERNALKTAAHSHVI